MSDSHRRQTALVVAALCVAALSWALRGSAAVAQSAADDPPGRVLDLAAQTPPSVAGPAVVRLRVGPAAPGAKLAVRLFGPVSTRAELWDSLVGPSPTPETTSWEINDLGPPGDDGRASVSVSIPAGDDMSSNGGDGVWGSGVRPLHIELTTADGAVIDTLRTFLTPPLGVSAARGGQLAVAVVLDLRLPPAHDADGGATADPTALARVLDFARVLSQRDGPHATIEISPETLDALALVGDDAGAAALRAALDGRELLASPWTTLDIDDWIGAGRADVVLDAMRRSREALGWFGAEPGSVMRFDEAPSPAAVGLLAGPAVGVRGFLAGVAPTAPPAPLHPVATVADAAAGSHRIALADPLLQAVLAGRDSDPELAAQWVLAELLRMAGAPGEPDSVIVYAAAFEQGARSGGVTAAGATPQQRAAALTEPAAVAWLLDGIAAYASLRPATVEEVLARTAAVGSVTQPGVSDSPSSDDFGRYLQARTEVEGRLHAYQSLIGAHDSAVTPLHTLLAVSVNPSLTADERTELLAAADRQVAQRIAGVQLVGRGRITVTERTAELPITLISAHPAPVTVALELASETVRFPSGDRPVVRLEPGRNDTSVPIEATAAGNSTVTVVVTTPDDAGGIALDSGTLSVRYAAVSGLGWVLMVAGGAAVTVWWLRAARRRPPGGEGAD